MDRKSTPCKRENATGRDRTSCKVIAAKTPRARLKPVNRDGRFAHGSKHAWQRKAASHATLRKLIAERNADV